MPPRNVDIDTYTTADDENAQELEPIDTEEAQEVKRPPMKIVWRNVIWFIWLHASALYGVYLIPWAHPLTWVWSK